MAIEVKSVLSGSRVNDQKRQGAAERSKCWVLFSWREEKTLVRTSLVSD